jgi:hypothetical protein
MQIILTTSLVGHGFAHNAGDTIDRPDAEAQRLIEAGYATAPEADKPKRGKAAKPAAAPTPPATPPAK